jgi:hypothetical protein
MSYLPAISVVVELLRGVTLVSIKQGMLDIGSGRWIVIVDVLTGRTGPGHRSVDRRARGIVSRLVP